MGRLMQEAELSKKVGFGFRDRGGEGKAERDRVGETGLIMMRIDLEQACEHKRGRGLLTSSE